MQYQDMQHKTREEVMLGNEELCTGITYLCNMARSTKREEVTLGMRLVEYPQINYFQLVIVVCQSLCTVQCTDVIYICL
jgi:hypothetical protein